jgi:hypothetical protein
MGNAMVDQGEVYYNLKDEVDAALKGYPCNVVCTSAGGSFHERWVNLSVYVNLPMDYAQDTEVAGEPLINFEVSPNRQQDPKRIKSWIWPHKEIWTFPYEGFRNTWLKVKAAGGSEEDPGPANQEEWWRNEVEKVKTTTKRTYDGD